MNPLRTLAVFLLGSSAAFAQVPSAEDPLSWLGSTPPAISAVRGGPSEVYPMAIDDKRWQVIHFYPDHSYLFWTANHVWQVRLDKLWTGTFKGIAMGAPRADVEATLGSPLAKGENWSIWNLPYQTFPRRFRVVFTDDLVSDLYLYRSDL